ncbi:hypothetical protein FXO38_30575 [Capsicum annuum]|nr:hypothetical protein FXO38_30575 [Capsicum annuum]
MGFKDKIVMFRWITERMALNGVHATWIKGGIRDSQQIKKGTLNFEGKVWWILAQHRLCSTVGDDVLNLVHASMVASFTVGYAFNVGEFLARVLGDRAVGSQ